MLNMLSRLGFPLVSLFYSYILNMIFCLGKEWVSFAIKNSIAYEILFQSEKDQKNVSVNVL